MTWRKTGSEFDGECAHVDLSDAAYRTHQEAIGHVYEVGSMECVFAKKRVRNFAHSDDAEQAVRELLEHGFWVDEGSTYRIVHHEDVIRQSLVAQGNKQVRDKKAQQARRDRQATTPAEPNVSADVSADTDRQTDRHLRDASEPTCKHGVRNGSMKEPWPVEKGQLLCSDCTRERKGA